jgi:7,8-dihydro-6-hydroxymethylpterin dimethyltransferase
MNASICNGCKTLVPSSRVERDGKVYLVKDCPACGPNETLISNSAVRSQAKRELDVHVQHAYEGCNLKCQMCGRHNNPKFTFLNITNRCNLNCPICFDNVPGLGFEFEPPMEYIESAFRQFAAMPRPPIVCLFGGEPTMRDDLFDIIALARSYRLRTRVFTNGLKLADEDYCRRLLQTRAELMFSFDGNHPNTYKQLRGTTEALELKRRALDNIAKNAKFLRSKITLNVVLAKDLNASEMNEILALCHERRDIIGTTFLMPLVHTWDNAKWDYDPPRMTTEDVEELVEKALPGHNLEFLPLGFAHELAVCLRRVTGDKVPYAGAHPNCESLTFLLSDGSQWVPMVHFLKGSESDLGRDLLTLGKRAAERDERWQRSGFGRALGALRIKNGILWTLGMSGVLGVVTRRVRIGRTFKGRSVGKVYHAAMLGAELAVGCQRRKAMARHTWIQGQLRVVILPLEDSRVLETERLERCPTAQAYVDPESGKVNFIPLCAWKLHNRTILRQIAERYQKATPPPAASRTGEDRSRAERKLVAVNQ